MKIGSLFSGGGGGDHGFTQSGHQIVFGAEIDKYARAVFRHHNPTVKLYEDVKEVTYERITADGIELPDAIFGGSPCQDLSRAGRRTGIEGTKSSLFFEQIRIADELRAAWLIWENVTGAFDTNKGQDFAAVLGAITGYEPAPPKRWQNGGVCVGPKRTAVWRVLDLQNFGSPQRRRRIFIVANSRTVEPRKVAEVLFDTKSSSGFAASNGKAGKENTAFVVSSVAGTGETGGLKTYASFLPVKTPGAITSQYYKGLGTETMQAGLAAITVTAPVEITGTLEANYHKGFSHNEAAAGLGAVITTFHSSYSGYYNIKEDPEIALTLKASTSLALAQGSTVRRLTPLECERLMGWPDGYTANGIDDMGNAIKISDTQRYKICGNGIGSPVTKWIGERLAKVEQ